MFVSLAYLAGCGGAGADDETIARCKKQAEDCAAAAVASDFDKFLDLTYPRVVQFAGGRATVLAAMRAEVDKGLKVVTADVETPTRVLVAGSDLIAVVPVRREIASGGKSVKSRSYFLGVSSDQGKSWTFIDGKNLDNAMLKRLLPHFPSGVRIP